MSFVVECPSCGKSTPRAEAVCRSCGISLAEAVAARDVETQTLRIERWEAAKKSGDFSPFTHDEISRYCQDIIVTTAGGIANHALEKEVAVLGAESVRGLNLLRNFFLSWTDKLGFRSSKTQNLLATMRQECLSELRLEAVKKGADAIISVSFSYEELSGGNKDGLLLLAATGTAVRLSK